MRPHQVPVDSIPSLRKLLTQPRARAEDCIDTLWAARDVCAVPRPLPSEGRGAGRSTTPSLLAEACAAPVKLAPRVAACLEQRQRCFCAAARLAGPVPQLCTEGRAHAASRLARNGSEILALRRLGPIQGKPPEVLGLFAEEQTHAARPPLHRGERALVSLPASGRPASSRVFSEEEPPRLEGTLTAVPLNRTEKDSRNRSGAAARPPRARARGRTSFSSRAFARTLRRPSRADATECVWCKPTHAQFRPPYTIETRLILPVVIRLSQRLSHACSNISIIKRSCEWLIISVIIY